MKVRMNNRLLAFNVVGGLVMVGAVVTVIKGTFARPHIEQCSQHYDRILAMRLDKSGRPMEAAEFQAATNGLDRGVLENFQVAKLAKGPAPFVMAVNVANPDAKETITKGESISDGVEFPWTPRSMIKGANSGCLTYHVMLPQDFDYQAGVTLPGLFGVLDGGSFSDEARVNGDIHFGADGKPQVKIYAKGAGAPAAAEVAYGLYTKEFPRGRWVKVEQELILNTPGKSDGAFRLWFNDELELDVKNADFRSTKDITVAGVSSSIIRNRKRDQDKPDLKPAVIQVSPFELRVK